MTRLNLKNNSETKLAQAVTANDTAFIVEDASVLPNAPFRLTVADEIIEVTSISGNELTVERAKEGTVAVDYEVGESLENRFTAGVYDGLASRQEVSQVEQNANSYTDEQIENIDFDTSDLEQKLTNLQNKLGNLDNLDTEERENLVTSINEVLRQLDEHKAERASQVLYVSRDTSLDGDQVVSLPFKAKSLLIFSAMTNPVISNSKGMWAENDVQRVLSTAQNGNSYISSNASIDIDQESGGRVLGKIVNVSSSGFVIQWSKHGETSGTVSLNILATTHGE